MCPVHKYNNEALLTTSLIQYSFTVHSNKLLTSPNVSDKQSLSLCPAAATPQLIAYYQFTAVQDVSFSVIYFDPAHHNCLEQTVNAVVLLLYVSH